jgi:hypothetical protein
MRITERRVVTWVERCFGSDKEADYKAVFLIVEINDMMSSIFTVDTASDS